MDPRAIRVSRILEGENMKLLTRAEELILLAVLGLDDEAYCVPIHKRISRTTGNKWSLGSIYMPLDRLVKRGLLESRLSVSTPERGGRHKRIYRVTRVGLEALKQVRKVEERMREGVAALIDEV
jgi:PadR family transcriptional regulator